MKVHTLELGAMGNCTYVVENQNKAIIIDPSWDMPAIENFLEELNLTLAAVFFTHGHYDHCTNAQELLQAHNLKGYMEESDTYLARVAPEFLQTFKGDCSVEAAGLKADFLHTPGHTPGSCCIMIEDCVFTGDTLFPGAAGRTDFPGSSPKQMQDSLERLAHLPPATKVYSGHAYGPHGNSDSTIGYEVKNNPFIKLALKDPHYFDDY